MNEWSVDDFKVDDVVYARIFYSHIRKLIKQGPATVTTVREGQIVVEFSSKGGDSKWATPSEDEVRHLTSLEKFLLCLE